MPVGRHARVHCRRIYNKDGSVAASGGTMAGADERDISRFADLADSYGELRRIARRLLAGDALQIVLQPTELVNEAALRLIRSEAAGSDRVHMLAIAARTMRRVMIDEARRHATAKRRPPTLMTLYPGTADKLVGMEDLDRALDALEQISPDHARIVELRFTLGMTVEETAAMTGLAERTVKRRWQAARAWLRDHLGEGDDER